MRPWVVAFAALTCLVWTTSQLQGQTAESRLAALEKLPNQERQQRLLEGAKSEGEGVIYANMDVAAMKPLTEGFMKRYPGLKAASVHFSGAAIITRIDSESRAGKTVIGRCSERPVRRTRADREESRRALPLSRTGILS